MGRKSIIPKFIVTMAILAMSFCLMTESTMAWIDIYQMQNSEQRPNRAKKAEETPLPTPRPTTTPMPTSTPQEPRANGAQKIQSTETENALATYREFTFQNGDYFRFYNVEFHKTDKENDYTLGFPITGNIVSIRWQDYSGTEAQWKIETSLEDLPFATLFIETDKESIVVGVPSVYKKNMVHSTREAVAGEEGPVRIMTIGDEQGKYILCEASFEANAKYIGDWWYFVSEKPIVNWENRESYWLVHDLYKDRRFAYDGFYLKTYTQYTPYAPTGYFRNPANYVGSSLVVYGGSESAHNMGYAMTVICMENQNEQGFWETGPKADWLYKDFGIEYGFYDTRFNTDFGENLLRGYKQFGEKQFLDSAQKYGDFFVQYASDYSYTVKGNGKPDGILVPDYWGKDQKVIPHVSLNHHVAEMNFLLNLYQVTNKRAYWDTAMNMYYGISNTKEQWVMPDQNLKYALYYTGNANRMVDYPYLTYNDLYQAKNILGTLDLNTEDIEFLMAQKKAWMDKNGIDGYIGKTK